MLRLTQRNILFFSHYFHCMKHNFWYSVGALLLAGPVQAQSLAGAWQGAETDVRGNGSYWPAVLRLQKSKTQGLLGVLYQEVGENPAVSVTFQMLGKQTGSEIRLEHKRKLNETGRTPTSYWCDGAITFTYNAQLEKLTGRATYRPVADCDHGTFTFYRIKLKSAAAVKAGVESTHRVSGRNVQWYADAALKSPIASGNTHRTKLRKTTTFYLTQGYYPTSQSPVVPITIQITGKAPVPKAPVAKAPAPAPAPPDITRSAPAPLVVPAAVILPTVLFKLGTAELLPEALPALNRLAEALKARPALKLRVAGHTDKLGEPEKNLALSEQRAEAVKAYLVQTGVSAERLSSVGYGDARPLYPSPDARNRRVEVAEVN